MGTLRKDCPNPGGHILVSLDSTMRRRLIRIALILLLLPPLLAAAAGWLAGPAFLHPLRRELTPDLIRKADSSFAVMMDARAHGASDGPIATYGWLERNDTRAIIDALISSELDPCFTVRYSALCRGGRAPSHIFALGESMGAGIVLQSAAVDPRIEAVVAEASFANLREAAYDYAGLRKYPWLGKTLFAPGTWTLLYRDEKLAGFAAAEVSPAKAVASRAFPVLLICDEKDVALPCRHSEMIYAAARGPKQLWVVPRAFHTAAYGFAPEEFRRRVLAFFASNTSRSP